MEFLGCEVLQGFDTAGGGYSMMTEFLKHVLAGGEAVGVLSLDSVPPAEALAEVQALPHVTRATIVRLPPAGEMPAWLGG